MDLEKLKAVQESLKKEIIIKPCGFKKGYVLAVDSAYISDRGEIISAAIVYDTEKDMVLEKVFSKKKFHSPIFPGFSLFGRLTLPLRQSAS